MFFCQSKFAGAVGRQSSDAIPLWTRGQCAGRSKGQLEGKGKEEEKIGMASTPHMHTLSIHSPTHAHPDLKPHPLTIRKAGLTTNCGPWNSLCLLLQRRVSRVLFRCRRHNGTVSRHLRESHSATGGWLAGHSNTER